MIRNNFSLSDLKAFTGTSRWYLHWSKLIVFTDGIEYLAEKAGAYWLVDLIAAHQLHPAVKRIPQLADFQLWTITVDNDHIAHITLQADSDLPAVVDIKVETDFPAVGQFKLYAAAGEREGKKITVLMVPSEW
jgi:hypothetical protein